MFTSGQLAAMRLAQESVMMHRAVFQPWRPAQDSRSGQPITDYEGLEETICGVDFSPKGTEVDTTEGVYVAHYKIRLPRSWADRARPLCRYVIVSAHGELLTRPYTLEQVSEPAIGPTAVVVWARNVV